MPMLRYCIAAALLAMATGCSVASHETSTPALHFSSLVGPSSTASHADASVCAAYTGEARGMCQALFGAGCTAPDGGPPICDRLARHFFEAAGEMPPFVHRFYVSRDPLTCSVILWLCADDFVSFIDETGCGCVRP